MNDPIIPRLYQTRVSHFVSFNVSSYPVKNNLNSDNSRPLLPFEMVTFRVIQSWVFHHIPISFILFVATIFTFLYFSFQFQSIIFFLWKIMFFLNHWWVYNDGYFVFFLFGWNSFISTRLWAEVFPLKPMNILRSIGWSCGPPTKCVLNPNSGMSQTTLRFCFPLSLKHMMFYILCTLRCHVSALLFLDGIKTLYLLIGYVFIIFSSIYEKNDKCLCFLLSFIFLQIL